MSITQMLSDIAEDYRSEACALRQELHELRLIHINTNSQRRLLLDHLELAAIRIARDDESFANRLKEICRMGELGYKITGKGSLGGNTAPDERSSRPARSSPVHTEAGATQTEPF